jgi:hypothetical protein
LRRALAWLESANLDREAVLDELEATEPGAEQH